MSRLKDLLSSTGLFEVISANDEGPMEQCIGRVADNRLWAQLLARFLRIEKMAMDNGDLSGNVLGISKFYYINPSGGVMYMWKVVCTNVGWFEANFPRIEKAEWAQGFNTTLDTDGMPKTVSLVSTTGKAKIPQPKDLGLSDASAGVTYSE